MRTAEDSSGTVLHRLIQEQLRYGNPTDPTLLAIQQQALRGGSSGGGAGSPRSSLESLTQEESLSPQLSTRQEPQGQEHQVDYQHSESPICQMYQLHTEELPTYEEAKAHSQYLAYQRNLETPGVDGGAEQEERVWYMKGEHARSLSEHLMQLSLERNCAHDNIPMSSSHSYPQLSNNHSGPVVNERSIHEQDQRGPPPEYPFMVRSPGYMLSHSQEHRHYYKEPPPAFHSQHHRLFPTQAQVPCHSGLPSLTPAGQDVIVGGYSITVNNCQIEQLIKENERLRGEVESYSEKAARLQKLEQEIQRISEAYETLMKGSAKREALEKTMRNKLESEIKRLHDFNRDLRDRLETANKQRAVMEVEDKSRHAFAKLVEQNEDHLRERELLEKELQHLRVSGEEWKRRREALEQALMSAQTRNRQLEEELRMKRADVEKVERMPSALAQLQAACEKREDLELRLRTRLEQELKSLRRQQWQSQAQQTSPGSYSDLNMSSLHQQLREREEHVLALEADITRWEQKYLEESTMRQFAMDAAATAAAQRDTTIINHSPRHLPNSSFNEDLLSPNPRHQEMENRIRVPYAQLLEKDAIIKVMQQRSRQGREQGRPESQGLRPAQSVPSINMVATASTTQTKGKSLSDDQTAAASLPHALTKTQCRDSSTQCEESNPKTEPAPEPSIAPSSDSTPLNTTQISSAVENDMVEILI
uniref:Angiomotin like 2a n=1 Tax=Cyprinus carpio TaxID=7962 RepID=A0A8C2IU46_CYPCA